MFKHIIIAVSLVFFTACGKDVSLTDKASVTDCSLTLGFVSATVSMGGFKTLTYSEDFGASCAALVENHSGGLSLSTYVNSPSNLGHLTSVTFNAYDKTRIYTTTEGSLANGNITISNTYTQSYAQSQEWILPWSGKDGHTVANFSMPEATDTLSYPRSVTIKLKATDY